MKLPLSKDPVTKIQYDSIYVVIDKFFKLAHCLPFKKSYNIKNLGYLWRDRIVCVRGDLEKIINN